MNLEFAMIYDCEILRAIPAISLPEVQKRANKSTKSFIFEEYGIEYCAGWQDFENMGISVIAAYDFYEQRYRIFCQDNFEAFRELVRTRSHYIGFNNLNFDNKLLAANGIQLWDDLAVDLLQIIWDALGLSNKFDKETHAGYGLNAICEANFGTVKTGHGELAPVLWQRGEIGKVIDYAINDIRLTQMLFEKIYFDQKIKNPKTGEMIKFKNLGL